MGADIIKTLIALLEEQEQIKIDYKEVVKS